MAWRTITRKTWLFVTRVRRVFFNLRYIVKCEFTGPHIISMVMLSRFNLLSRRLNVEL